MREVLFHIGSFEVRSYSVLIFIGFLAGLYLTRKRAKTFNIDQNAITDLCVGALFVGILGARVVYILQELPYYLDPIHRHELWSLRFDGLTSFGGLVFGFLYVVFWTWRKKYPLPGILDIMAPGFLIAHAFGRIGCYLNGCCSGGVCDEHTFLAAQLTINGATHWHLPAQLYDTGMNVLALLILLRVEKRGLATGQSFSLMLILHGLTRFIYEFWRSGTVEEVRTGLASSTRIPGLPITEAQAFALFLILTGIALFIAFSRRGYINQEVPVT